MSEESQNWTCPFCNRPQTVTAKQTHANDHTISLSEHKYGELKLLVFAKACANPECREVELEAVLVKGRSEWTGSSHKFRDMEVVDRYSLRPQGRSKPQPDYIPAPIREDYYEACAVAELSPKGSATLARRCLQGMIRDFCKISRKTLFLEIEALRELLEQEKAPPGVTAETVEAIDYVRSVGNIGAHMEKDIDLVIPVDTGEAQALIELIELLFAEWYVARQVRSERLSRVKQIAEAKKAITTQIATEPQTPETT